MIALAIGLGVIFGIGLGMGLGRFFCKWHHKEDESANNLVDSRYNPLEQQDDICQPFTIGDEIKSVRNCKCSPGCGVENCCGDENCGRCSE